MARVLLLDIGNVLIKKEKNSLLNYIKNTVGLIAIKRQDEVKEILRTLEKGQLDFTDAVSNIADLLEHSFDIDNFKNMYNSQFMECYKNYEGYLRFLGKYGSFRLRIATNISKEHWEHLRKRHDTKYITYLAGYKSYEMGIKKSNPKFFEHVIKKENVAPENFLLIDNNMKYIQTARNFGMKAELFRYPLGVEILKGILNHHEFHDNITIGKKNQLANKS